MAERLRRIHPHVWAALALAGAVIAYLAPALFGGKVFSPNAVLFNFYPWIPARPAGIEGYLNPEMSDPSQQITVWLHYARGQLHAGDIPQWNPYAMSGTPFWANGQLGLLSPFHLPTWLLSFNWSLGATAALQLWVAAFGSYLLARQLRLGFAAGIFAGVAFAFCSFNLLWLSYPLASVSPLLPWLILFAERIAERGRVVDAVWLAVVVAIAFVGGHPGTQGHLVLALGIYAVLRCALLPATAWRSRGLRVALVGGGLVAGIALAALVFLPQALRASDSWGSVIRQGGGGHLPSGGLRTILFPWWWSRPQMSAGAYPGAGIAERTVYAGVLAPMLAVAALAMRERWRERLPFLVIGLLALAVAFGAEPFYSVIAHTPLLSNVHNARMTLLFEFGAVMLAAFGFDRAVGMRGAPVAALGAGVAAVLAGVIVLQAYHPTGEELRAVRTHLLTGRDFSGMGDVVRLTSIAWWIVLSVLATAAVSLHWPRARPVVAALLFALALYAALKYGRGASQIRAQTDSWWQTLVAGALIAVVAIRRLWPLVFVAALMALAAAIDLARFGQGYPSVVTSIPALVVFLVAVAALALTRAEPGRHAVAFGLLAVLGLNVAYFVYRVQPLADPVAMKQPEVAAVDAARGPGGYRTTGLDRFTMPPDSGMWFGMRDIRGYDPPEPKRRYYELWHWPEPPDLSGDGLNIGGYNERWRRLMDMLSVRYAMVSPYAPELKQPGMHLLHHAADAAVYRNDDALPRAYVPASVKRVTGADGAFAAVTANDFDPADAAIVEDAVGAGAGSASLSRDDPEHVRIQAAMQRGGLLVLTDKMDDGWRVSVDGEDAKPLYVNSVVRGVAVPAGRHTVDWRYRTPGLLAGTAISLLALAGLVAALVLGRRREWSV